MADDAPNPDVPLSSTEIGEDWRNEGSPNSDGDSGPDDDDSWVGNKGLFALILGGVAAIFGPQIADSIQKLFERFKGDDGDKAPQTDPKDNTVYTPDEVKNYSALAGKDNIIKMQKALGVEQTGILTGEPDDPTIIAAKKALAAEKNPLGAILSMFTAKQDEPDGRLDKSTLYGMIDMAKAHQSELQISDADMAQLQRVKNAQMAMDGLTPVVKEVAHKAADISSGALADVKRAGAALGAFFTGGTQESPAPAPLTNIAVARTADGRAVGGA